MEDADPRTDAQLLQATATDPDAFAVFYRRHVRAVLTTCARRCGDAELAADVAAETFAVALVHSRRFDARRGTAGAWLHGIAANRLADARRRGHAERRARRRLGIESIALTPADVERIDELASLPEGTDAADLLAQLPDEQRRAVEARVVQERDYPAIAAELDVTEAAARQRVSRGLASLRRRLETEGRAGG